MIITCIDVGKNEYVVRIYLIYIYMYCCNIISTKRYIVYIEYINISSIDIMNHYYYFPSVICHITTRKKAAKKQ